MKTVHHHRRPIFATAAATAVVAASSSSSVAVDAFSPSASARTGRTSVGSIGTSTGRTHVGSGVGSIVGGRTVPLTGGSTTTTALRMAQKMTPTRRTRREDSFDRDASEDDAGDDEPILDFSEAQAKIKEDENRRRVEEGLTTGLTKEDEEEFNAKKDAYDDMRAKIRARASEEGFEKSVATKKAIEEATQRAMAGSSSATPDQMLDLSGFGEKFVDDGTEELTPEEQAEIDKIANMPYWEQIQEELANTRFPTPGAVFQTACVMALIFAVSATLILKGDVVIRDFYTDLGFIPRPDEVYDFSDLELPDGFLEQQDLESDIGSAVQAATSIADQILPPSSP